MLGDHFPVDEHSLSEAGHVRRNEQPRLDPSQLERPRHFEGDGPLQKKKTRGISDQSRVTVDGAYFFNL